MKEAKFVVMYPDPSDIDTFETRYRQEHVPMALEKLTGKTRFVATRVVSAVGDNKAPYHRIAEVHFPTMQELNACLNSPGGQETARHAIEISTGGAPVFLISETETTDF